MSVGVRIRLHARADEPAARTWRGSRRCGRRAGATWRAVPRRRALHAPSMRSSRRSPRASRPTTCRCAGASRVYLARLLELPAVREWIEAGMRRDLARRGRTRRSASLPAPCCRTCAQRSSLSIAAHRLRALRYWSRCWRWLHVARGLHRRAVSHSRPGDAASAALRTGRPGRSSAGLERGPAVRSLGRRCSRAAARPRLGARLGRRLRAGTGARRAATRRRCARSSSASSKPHRIVLVQPKPRSRKVDDTG